ncbi:MAG: hypothetical protein ACTHMA_04670 [Thermomicrobiales bacterium]
MRVPHKAVCSAPWRRLLTLCACLILTLGNLPAPAGATAAMNEDAPPAAGGMARLGNMAYIYARRTDSGVWVRKTDGLWYTGWSPLGGATDLLPAAAGQGAFINVFVRGQDGGLWVNRTADGRTYAGWQALGGQLGAAPAAAGFGTRSYVFTLDPAGNVAARVSGDGRTFSAPIALGGTLAAAPVATVVNGALTLFGKGRDGRLYTRATRDGTTADSWSGWQPRGGDVPAWPLAGPSDPTDYPLALDVGVNFISPNDWETYQLPAYTDLRPSLAKFSMFYDGDPYRPMFPASAIDEVIARGARTIIFRTAETHIAPEDVERELHAPLPGDSRSLLDYIAGQRAQGSPVEFWIEVGNEPDLSGLAPLAARADLLHTIREVAPRYRANYPNLRWLASLPTRTGLLDSPNPNDHGLAYLDQVLSDTGDGLGDVASQYDALGVHIYGADTLQQSFPSLHAATADYDCADSNGDVNCPLAVLDRVLSRTDRPIFITEAGINSALAWPFKAKYYVDALYRLPSQVRGFAIFTLSRDPEWYAGDSPQCDKPQGCTRYALDVDEQGAIDPGFTGAAGIGRCYQAAGSETTARDMPPAAGCWRPCGLLAGATAPTGVLEPCAPRSADRGQLRP